MKCILEDSRSLHELKLYHFPRKTLKQTSGTSIEHLRAFKNNYPEKSAVAQHMLKKDDVDRRYLHNFDHTCLKLLKNGSNTNHLDAVESIMIQQDSSGKLMNLDEEPLESELLTLPLCLYDQSNNRFRFDFFCVKI
jgi:hypothetical protein